MLSGYIQKMNIVLPKADIQLDKNAYPVGSNIKGSIELKGGLLKNKVKRFDIDLVGRDLNTKQEETMNSHTVLFNVSSLPDKSEAIPFSFYIPVEIKTALQYILMINIVLENTKCITKNIPISIKSES